jgi:hypothetical protein
VEQPKGFPLRPAAAGPLQVRGTTWSGVWLKKTDPDLLAARMKSPISADQKFSDRAVMSAILVVSIGWFGFMAIDARRCGWSHAPLCAQALGAALIVGAFYGWVGAR